MEGTEGMEGKGREGARGAGGGPDIANQVRFIYPGRPARMERPCEWVRWQAGPRAGRRALVWVGGPS